MKSRLVVLLGMSLLAGCSSMQQVVREEPASRQTTAAPKPNADRYEPLIGQDVDALAELRVAPAPNKPEMVDGKTQNGDEQVLGGRGYVRIGNGYYVGTEQDKREAALRQGERVGADKVFFYRDNTASDGANDGAPSQFVSAFYVHVKPPFGASFRDLNPAEKENLASTGGVQIGAVIGGSPAAAANLRAGDFVLTVDGKAVQNKAAFQEMLRANAGKRVKLGISRDGGLLIRVVRVGLLPAMTRH